MTSVLSVRYYQLHPSPQPNELIIPHTEQDRDQNYCTYNKQQIISAQTVKLLDIVSDFTIISKQAEPSEETTLTTFLAQQLTIILKSISGLYNLKTQ